MVTDPIPLLGLMPDLEEVRPGVIVDTEIEGVTTNSVGFLPLSNGFGNVPGFVPIGSALSAECQGAAAVIVTNGSVRTFAGTASALYELSGTAYTDVSRGGGYTAGANRWRFTAYGDYIYATDKTDAVQKSTGAGFADVLTIPKCDFIDRVKDFVIIASTSETTYGDQADRWWCSALGAPDDFVPNIATQCVTNRVTDSPGAITASKSLGDAWIIYKQGSMFMGTYQGPPFVWDFQRVSDFIGAWSNESVVKVGYSHYFIGPDDFYVFDGAVPRPIPNDLKNWFFDRLDKDYAYKIQGFYDRYRSIVIWFYPGPTNTAGEITNFVCVNLKKGTWGGGKALIEAILEYHSGGMTYDEFYPPTGSTTWDSLPAIAFDSPFFSGGQITMAGFSSGHVLGTFSGDNADGIQFTLADVGDDAKFSTLSRVYPRWMLAPSAASMYYAGRKHMGETATFGAATSLYHGRFNKMASNRWHRVAFSVDGEPAVIASICYDFEEDGEE